LIPPPAVQDVIRFELNLLGSVAAMLAVGVALYVSGQMRHSAAGQT
jgi:hypothetical protein